MGDRWAGDSEDREDEEVKALRGADEEGVFLALMRQVQGDAGAVGTAAGWAVLGGAHLTPSRAYLHIPCAPLLVVLQHLFRLSAAGG